MADQSSAADEYVLLQEVTAPLTMLPDDPVAVAADVHFPVVLRGYDRPAVDAYVKRTRQLVAELEGTRSPEAAIRRAIARVGEQVSGILQLAHDTAGQIIARARVEAEDRLEVSHQEAAQIAAVGEQRRRDLDADTDRIGAERLRIVDDARGLAGQLIALAESSTERFPPAGPEVTAEPEVGAEPDAVAELWAAAAGRATDTMGRRCYRRSDRLGTLRRPRTNSNPADVNRERGRSPRGLPLPSRAAARLRLRNDCSSCSRAAQRFVTAASPGPTSSPRPAVRSN